MVSNVLGARSRSAPGPLALTGRPPATRPRALGWLVLPVVGAAVIGFALAYDLHATVVVVVAALVTGWLLFHLEAAALIVVAAAVFDDYLGLLNPFATKGLAVLLVGAWVVRRGWGRVHESQRSPVLTMLGVFLAVLLLATAVHTNGATGLGVVARYLGFAAVLAVLVDTMRGGLAPRRVAAAYVASCGAAAVCGLLTFALAVDRRVGGPIGDPNDFAFFLLAALPLSLALRVGARRPWVWDVVSALLVVAVLGTFSRGALVGLVAVLLVGALTRVVSLRALAAGLVVAGTLTAVSVGVFNQLVDTSIEQKDAVADQNVTERVDLWRAASEMTLENPVLGLGPGSFGLFHQDFRDRLPTDITHDLDVAHNTYLEVSAETGLLGLLAWSALLGTAGLAAWSRWRTDRDPLAGGVVLGLVGAVVSSFFVTEQYALPLWLLMGLAASLQRPPPSTSTLLHAPAQAQA